MFESLWQDIKFQLRTGGFWTKVIFINCAVFLLVNFFRGFCNFVQPDLVSYTFVVRLFSVSSDLSEIAWRPWTLVSHIFLHEGFWHLLWNCLILYWFSRIVVDLIGYNRSILIFFESALVGVLFFVLSAHWLPWYAHTTLYAQGCSAGVYGLLFAAATLAPNYGIRLLLIGEVAIKYLAFILLVIDLIFAFQIQNSGGHFAHVGGALWGYAYVRLLRQGVNVDFIIQWLSGTARRYKGGVKHSRTKKTENPKSKEKNFDLDALLEKIKRKGIQSLSAEEKEFLDHMSRK